MSDAQEDKKRPPSMELLRGLGTGRKGDQL